MNQNFSDIISRVGSPPLWWGVNGVPRWCEFHPSHTTSIYAGEVVLLEVACQGCGTQFPCEVTWDPYSRGWNDGIIPPLSQNIQDIHYGDPPNVGCCGPGPTMSSIPLRILQFWIRVGGIWIRREEREIPLNTSKVTPGETL